MPLMNRHFLVSEGAAVCPKETSHPGSPAKGDVQFNVWHYSLRLFLIKVAIVSSDNLLNYISTHNFLKIRIVRNLNIIYFKLKK